MDASDNTSRNGKSATDASDLESLGCILLQERLEIAGGRVREAFFGTASTLRFTGRLEDIDVDELDHAVQEAQQIVDQLREVKENEQGEEEV